MEEIKKELDYIIKQQESLFKSAAKTKNFEDRKIYLDYAKISQERINLLTNILELDEEITL